MRDRSFGPTVLVGLGGAVLAVLAMRTGRLGAGKDSRQVNVDDALPFLQRRFLRRPHGGDSPGRAAG